MCGIVGYVGKKDAVPFLIEGLKRLEYRGYDSAGLAVIKNRQLLIFKTAGKVNRLEKIINRKANDLKNATIGISHTRWATHGSPNEINAHPHFDCMRRLAVVHNGIIENYEALRRWLEQKNHKFKSETDTETVIHLLEEFLNQSAKTKKQNNFLTSLIKTIQTIKGSYALAVIDVLNPETIYAVRCSSPLIIGQGKNENFLASDASPFVGRTNKIIYLDEKEIAVITADKISTFDLEQKPKEIIVSQLETTLENIQKGNFPHFMLKEIHDQPQTVSNALAGRLRLKEKIIKLGGLEPILPKLLKAKRFIMIGCGTSWHAGLVGEYLFEEIIGIPAETEYASEFRYRRTPLSKDDVVVIISQSGETADTLAALRESKKRGALVIGIVNVVNSSIARETEAGVYIHAGPEIGVASTKAFTSQLTVLNLMALWLAKHKKTINNRQYHQIMEALAVLPEKIKQVLQNSKIIEKLAKIFKETTNCLYLGRGINFPTALEGALKLKEISYIHAEGYPAAEMKHGPIALIDKNMPVIFIMPQPNNGIYQKVISNLEEVKTRQGKIIAIANENDNQIDKLADFTIKIPATLEILSPILNVIPLQLLAYYIARERGCPIDQPRNLAKSVTVE